jgi:hypothetical protein
MTKRITPIMIDKKKQAASNNLNSSTLLLSMWSFGSRPNGPSFVAAFGDQTKATLFTKHRLSVKKISKGLFMDVPLAAELISGDAMLPRQSGDVVAAVAAFRGEFARCNVADSSDINMVQGPGKGLCRQVIALH